MSSECLNKKPAMAKVSAGFLLRAKSNLVIFCWYIVQQYLDQL